MRNPIFQRNDSAEQPSVLPTVAEKSAVLLDRLLIAGGDARIALGDGGINAYGCTAAPRPATLSFSSTTASTISERAYNSAGKMLSDLLNANGDFFEPFDTAMNRLRADLRACLELEDSGAEIVFSPSGTDSQLHALFFAKLALGNPLTTIVVGADQTGSGTSYTSRGCNFAERTAKGDAVEKGSPIPGLAEGTTAIDIALVTDGGGRRSDSELDASILDTIAGEIAKGRRVALQIMDASKLGWRAPSDRCLRGIAKRWPGSVLVVVDACQMRLSRSRLRAYLDRGYLVLITGSKFFAGPAFSGATLLPAKLASRIEAMDILPGGLSDYACPADIPAGWSRLRARIQGAPNIGELLRWTAALEEIRSYYALPSSFRRDTMHALSGALERLIADAPDLELLPERTRPADGIDDEEMAARSVFAFLLRDGDRYHDYASCVAFYRALNRALAADDGAGRACAASLCHIGQPVRMIQGGQSVAALRISIGARHLVDIWSRDDSTRRRLLAETIAAAAQTIAKLAWLIESPARAGAIQER